MKKNKKVNINSSKSALLIGIGRWGETIAKILLRNGYKLKYATRNSNVNKDFENKIGSRLLSHFSQSQKDFFDLVVIAVRPNDFFAAWSIYKKFSNKFLIEKPGAINKFQINEIFKEADNEKKSIFINYEYIYTGESLLLKEKLRGKEHLIEEISIIWEKELHTKGGLEWRILPHLIADLLLVSKNNIYIKESQITSQRIKLKGNFKNSSLLIEFNDKKKSRYENKIKLSNNEVFIKERNKLIQNGKIIYKEEILSVDNIVRLCEFAPKETFLINNNISKDILDIIDAI